MNEQQLPGRLHELPNVGFSIAAGVKDKFLLPWPFSHFVALRRMLSHEALASLRGWRDAAS